jgi:hypothetical protein
MLHVGAAVGTQIVIVPPLFEEANRLRKTLVDVMRGLAQRGFGAALPDLPATGESIAAYSATTFEDWQAALAAVVATVRPDGGRVFLASFRGGALIDHAVAVDGRWRLAEETGARLLRDLSRMVLARSFRIKGDDPLDESGYLLPAPFKLALEAAIPQEVAGLRTVRLINDPAEAHARIAGASIWRRIEPTEDAVLLQATIDDIAGWAKTCAPS